MIPAQHICFGKLRIYGDHVEIGNNLVYTNGSDEIFVQTKMGSFRFTPDVDGSLIICNINGVRIEPTIKSGCPGIKIYRTKP